MDEVQYDTVNCVFQRDWWLDAIAPGSWRRLEVIDGGKVRAQMPIIETSRYGMKMVAMPRLTQTLGPWVEKSEQKMASRIAQEKDWLNDLLDQMPEFDYFCQNWHYSRQYWLPFLWRGYQSSVCYTYALPDLTDLDAIWSGYRDSCRRQIRKAKKMVEVRTDLGVETLWNLTLKSFANHGRKPAYSFEYLQRLHAACEEHQACRTFFAEDASGNLHAALFMVWDENAAYYLIGGADSEYRNSGAMSLLMHEAIQHASAVSRTFDFEGSITEPIERFIRGFGGNPQPFFTIRGYSRRMQMMTNFRNMFARAAG